MLAAATLTSSICSINPTVLFSIDKDCCNYYVCMYKEGKIEYVGLQNKVYFVYFRQFAQKSFQKWISIDLKHNMRT